MSEPGPVEPGYGGDIARIGDRLAALERMALTPTYVGMQVPYSGPLASTSGEIEVQPGFLLANGVDVPLTRWPELVVMEGLWGTASAGMVRLPNVPASGEQTGTLVYAGRRAPDPAVLVGGETAFVVAAAADIGHVNGSSGSWRPPSGSSSGSGNSTGEFTASFGAGTYNQRLGLFRWDTSPLPDGVTVLAASLRLKIDSISNPGARTLSGEWYNAGTIDTGDYVASVGVTALNALPWSSLVASALNDIPLLNADANVNRTGYTGLRLGDGTAGAPVAANEIDYFAWHATEPRPTLILTLA